jgi:carboxymethylenebutenolidase
VLEVAGVWFAWYELNAAHAFLRDEGDRYDPATARLGIGLAADLFRRCL